MMLRFRCALKDNRLLLARSYNTMRSDGEIKILIGRQTY